jgi:hypothetical protein
MNAPVVGESSASPLGGALRLRDIPVELMQMIMRYCQRAPTLQIVRMVCCQMRDMLPTPTHLRNTLVWRDAVEYGYWELLPYLFCQLSMSCSIADKITDISIGKIPYSPIFLEWLEERGLISYDSIEGLFTGRSADNRRKIKWLHDNGLFNLAKLADYACNALTLHLDNVEYMLNIGAIAKGDLTIIISKRHAAKLPIFALCDLAIRHGVKLQPEIMHHMLQYGHHKLFVDTILTGCFVKQLNYDSYVVFGGEVVKLIMNNVKFARFTPNAYKILFKSKTSTMAPMAAGSRRFASRDDVTAETALYGYGVRIHPCVLQRAILEAGLSGKYELVDWYCSISHECYVDRLTNLYSCPNPRIDAAIGTALGFPRPSR